MKRCWMYVSIAILMISISASAQTQTNLVAMPNLIGVTQDQANETLSNANLTPNYRFQYNDAFEKDEIFWQEYTPRGNISRGRTISISVSLGPHPVKIENPKKNDLVNSFVIVSGNTSSSLSQGYSLWIVVNPLNSSKNYWPQSGGPLMVGNDGRFDGVAFLGGARNDTFNIVVLVADQELSDAFSKYIEACSARNNWPPITEEGEGYEMVSKKIIDDHKGDNVLVKLNGRY